MHGHIIFGPEIVIDTVTLSYGCFRPGRPTETLKSCEYYKIHANFILRWLIKNNN